MYINGKKKNINNKFIYLFYDKYLIYSNLHISIYSIFITWLLEWSFLMQYSWNFWSYTRVIYPYKLPGSLLMFFFFWIYIWGISIWRRTLHGRFTRGDRKLWFKGFASFWFTELSTIIGIYIAACWMNWGPLPLMPRYFLMQKKGFLVEMSLFTYVIWLLYLLRFGLKIYLWRTQAGITTSIIFILSCLLWRDFSTLYSRDIINLQSGSKWKYIKLNMILYSLSSSWWVNRYMGDNVDGYSLFTPIRELLKNNFSTSPFISTLVMTEYQSYHWMPITFTDDFDINGLPFLDWNANLDDLMINSFTSNNKIVYIFGDIFLDSYKFYPRKIGFYPKKIAMWYFLVVLKIWHHLMLFIWWIFYLLRLETKKRNSYSFLSSCYFNLYCCIIICILVYCFHFLPIWERSFRIRWPLRRHLFNLATATRGVNYSIEIWFYRPNNYGGFYLFKLLFYENIYEFIETFNDFFFNNNKYILDTNLYDVFWMFSDNSGEWISIFLYI